MAVIPSGTHEVSLVKAVFGEQYGKPCIMLTFTDSKLNHITRYCFVTENAYASTDEIMRTFGVAIDEEDLPQQLQRLTKETPRCRIKVGERGRDEYRERTVLDVYPLIPKEKEAPPEVLAQRFKDALAATKAKRSTIPPAPKVDPNDLTMIGDDEGVSL